MNFETSSTSGGENEGVPLYVQRIIDVNSVKSRVRSVGYTRNVMLCIGTCGERVKGRAETEEEEEEGNARTQTAHPL